MKKLEVRLTGFQGDSITVGTLAEQHRRMYFEFAADFLDSGLDLSPFKLPLRPGLIEHVDHHFGPLPGLFDDSLPDGWGLLLMDRHFQLRGIERASVSPLDRLAYLGTRTMGALTYHPPHEARHDEQPLDLYELGRNAEEVLLGDTAVILSQLMRAGGSPGGARPKVLVGIRDDRIVSGEEDLTDGFEYWLVKFAARSEVRDAGPVEFAYSLMARAAGLDMPESRLFDVAGERGTRHFFGVKRFDRRLGNNRVHVHTFANLVHADFRIPSMDYADLFKVTRALTRNYHDVLCVFRQMVFNVAAHNRDDHAKNFAFMLNPDGDWSLTPAYDLTFSSGPGGEHTMTVSGEGRAPDRTHCLKLAEQAGVKPQDAESIIEEVNFAISRWFDFSKQAGCTKKISSTIAATIGPL